jgi:hypothetical protein
VAPTSLIAALAALAVVLLLLREWWMVGAIRRRLRAQWVRAERGEESAERLLVRGGWSIEGRQVSTRYDLRVDGEPSSVLVRADYIVRRGGRRYVAEVKTGRLAPRIETSSTRRQLLEYRIAFGVDGVLLVDADAARVSFIEFPWLPARPRMSRTLFWLTSVGFLAAVFVALWR